MFFWIGIAVGATVGIIASVCFLRAAEHEAFRRFW